MIILITDLARTSAVSCLISIQLRFFSTLSTWIIVFCSESSTSTVFELQRLASSEEIQIFCDVDSSSSLSSSITNIYDIETPTCSGCSDISAPVSALYDG